MPRSPLIRAAVAVTLILLASGCGREDKNNDQDDTFQLTGDINTFDKRQWIAKVGMTLRNGHVLSEEQINQLEPKSQDAIIDELMQDPLFGDTVLEYNLKFLGFKSDNLKYPDASPFAYFLSKTNYPSAITSAREVMKDGDYLTLFALEQPAYAVPNAPSFFLSGEDTKNKTSKQLRAEGYKEILGWLDELAEGYRGDMDPNDFCNLYFNFLFSQESFEKFGIEREARNQFNRSENWFKDINLYCTSYPYEEDIPNFDSQFTNIKRNLATLKPYLASLDQENYKIENLSDIRELDKTKLKVELKGEMLTGFGFWLNLPNSSTNYNRKRAAYILKRFFCDDLTPINVALPKNHGGDKHSSDPSCQSCHYKLDPMAGFFRNIGSFGQSFEGIEDIYFDDGASLNREDYIASWKAEDGADHPWNVGYIRSLDDDSRNDYSSNPEDPGLKELFEIIKTAPEANKCLVKNMFQFFVGENLTIDAGYLDHLAQTFEETSKENSAIAFKETVKTLLSSNTFQQKDPEQGQCYDFRPGVDPAGLPPCKVSFVLNKNCGSCHTGPGSAGGLDLSTWTKTGGNTMSFPHIVGGTQKDAVETFQAIADRLTTDDLNLRMPLDRHIESGEREQLYLWSLEMLETHQTGQKGANP